MPGLPGRVARCLPRELSEFGRIGCACGRWIPMLSSSRRSREDHPAPIDFRGPAPSQRMPGRRQGPQELSSGLGLRGRLYASPALPDRAPVVGLRSMASFEVNRVGIRPAPARCSMAPENPPVPVCAVTAAGQPRGAATLARIVKGPCHDLFIMDQRRCHRRGGNWSALSSCQE